ncbi:MAG: hypothetical protein JXA87_06875 [Thermoleophilia bacterium]|nr:hypothetical protein [Thermoleophilia bacterium]
MADDREPGQDRPSHRPDPAFLDRLADDAEWREYDTSQSERRVDRHRQGRPPRGAGRRPGATSKEGGRRLPALIVLVVVAVVIAVVGLEAGTSESGTTGSGGSSPFYMLPLDTDAVTSTVSTEPPSTTAPADTTSNSDDTIPETSITSSTTSP